MSLTVSDIIVLDTELCLHTTERKGRGLDIGITHFVIFVPLCKDFFFVLLKPKILFADLS